MKLTVLLPAAMVVLLTSCSSLKVNTDYDRGKDFSTMKTYSMHDNVNAQDQSKTTVSSLNLDRVIKEIKANLNAKGYTENTASPDFTVNVNVVIKTLANVTANTMFDGGLGYGGAYRPYGYWGDGVAGTATTSFDVDQYQDGSLIIDMVDAKTNKLFWQGVGEGQFEGQISNPDKKINVLVTNTLAKFPKMGEQVKQ